jgi:hypothetical protein
LVCGSLQKVIREIIVIHRGFYGYYSRKNPQKGVVVVNEGNIRDVAKTSMFCASVSAVCGKTDLFEGVLPQIRESLSLA